MRFLYRADGAISASLVCFAATRIFFCLLQEGAALRHMLLHIGESGFSATGTEEVAAKKDPENENSWLCRISKEHGACGKREHYDLQGKRHVDLYCPIELCCSKTVCIGASCGSWCSGNWAFCSTDIVYHSEYSYGNCSCKRFEEKCDINAECVHGNNEEAGVFCRCKQGYWGDGKTCKIDLCATNPCGAGTCERIDDQYRCQCPKTHKIVTIEGNETCQERIDYCSTQPCGPEVMVKECRNTEEGYQCSCRQGYELQNNRCVELDLCAASPCGPPEGVHSCTTERQPKLVRRCKCKTGYELRVSPDGETETCVKDWCYGEPCGPLDRVSSCSSNATGYSCLCKKGYVTSINDKGGEVCVRQDICKQAPCGPPDSVKQCYLEGSSYRCKCQPGYTEVNSDGLRRCALGDPCHLGLCGMPAAVKECSTDGSSYSCRCNAGFTEILKEGQRTCVRETECTARCGNSGAVKSCELLEHGEIKCTCQAGYIYKYRAGVGRCEAGNPCSVYPCGEREAVKSCTPAGSSYTCECNDGFAARTLMDGSQICASASSCAGQPCGPPDVAQACLSTEEGYTCNCKEGFIQRLVDGFPRCTLADRGREETQDTGRWDKAEEKSEVAEFPHKAIAGGLVGILLLLAAAGGAAVCRRRQATNGSNVVDDVYEPFLSPVVGVGPQNFPQAWAQSPSLLVSSASPHHVSTCSTLWRN